MNYLKGFTSSVAQYTGLDTAATSIFLSKREIQAQKQELHDLELFKLIETSPEVVAKYLLLTRRLSRWRTRVVAAKGYLAKSQWAFDNNSEHQVEIDLILLSDDIAARLEEYITRYNKELEIEELELEKLTDENSPEESENDKSSDSE